MIVAFLLIGFFGMWKDTMSTMAIIAVCTLISIVLGVPVGILMARSDRVQPARLKAAKHVFRARPRSLSTPRKFRPG